MYRVETFVAIAAEEPYFNEGKAGSTQPEIGVAAAGSHNVLMIGPPVPDKAILAEWHSGTYFRACFEAAVWCT